jgi:hypothetical protein
VNRSRVRRPLCRIDVFDGGRAWQAHNPCPIMERRMARLPGAGSFYWPSPRAAWRAARVLMAASPGRSARVETISGRRVGYIAPGMAYAYDGSER